MTMKPFTIVMPRSAAEASACAAKPQSLVKAGGIDVLDRLKERIDNPQDLVNLQPLRAELGQLRSTATGALDIGALVTVARLELDALFATPALQALRQAAAGTASPQVRNRATVAGNLLQLARCWYLRSAAFGCLHGKKGPACLAMTGENRYHAVMGYQDCVRVHPSNLAPALLALGAEYTTQLGDRTTRRPLTALFPAEPKALAEEHTLQPGEVVTAVHVPVQPEGSRSAYQESREKAAFDWSTTAAAVWVRMAGKVVREARIVLGAVAPVPIACPGAAQLLVGKEPTDALFLEVADAAYADAAPLAHNQYKVPVGKAVLREALHECTR